MGLFMMLLTFLATVLTMWAINLMWRSKTLGLKFMFGLGVMSVSMGLWILDLMVFSSLLGV